MPLIRAFKALRPRPEIAARVASPPYDVLNSDEAREMVRDNPLSFLRVNKPEVDFDASTDIYAEEVYLKGRENLDRLKNDGVMFMEEMPALYLYRLTWRDRSQTGLACLASVAEYDSGLIKKHEHTRPDKVNDRAHHILTLGAQVGPVLSIFRQNPGIKRLFESITANAPDVDFEAVDNVRHQLWVVNEPGAIGDMARAFGALDALYIADGHHRSEAASEVCRRMKESNKSHTGEEPYNFFLTVIFPDEELHILPYNRVVKDLNGFSRNELLKRTESKFTVSGASKPLDLNQEHEIGFYSDGKWHKLLPQQNSFDSNDPVARIDAAILYDNLLRPLLGIEDIRTDKRIDFVGGIRGDKELERLVDSGQWQAAFSLQPVSVAQLLDVADAVQVMPPKSTWFEPKLRSGMVVNIIE